MAIKIIKNGVKEFNMTCPNCGCEFTYENEDICNSAIVCPYCGIVLPHKGPSGTISFPPEPIPIWFNQPVAPDGYKIKGGPNKPTDKYNDLVHRQPPLPGWATQSDNWSDCEGCPNNPKYHKKLYIGDGPCNWCQKNPRRVTCTLDPVESDK